MIHLNFERNRGIINIHHAAIFDKHQLSTFLDNRYTHTKTHTFTPMKIIPLQKQSFGRGNKKDTSSYLEWLKKRILIF